MESAISPKTEYLLEAGLDVLHFESKEWLAQINHWKEEIDFFEIVTQNKICALDISSRLDVVKKNILEIRDGIKSMHKEVEQHKHFLFVLLKSEKPDEEAYREKHKNLGAKFELLSHRFENVKAEIFEMTKSGKASFLRISDTLKMIYDRRAVRKYKSTEVEHKLIEQIIDAGRMAPSAINLQPWKFIVVTKKEMIKAFSDEIAKVAASFITLLHGPDFTKTHDPIFHEAPVVIFLVGPKNDDWAAMDIGLCAQNMMLAAKSMGLDTCPVGFARLIEQTPAYAKLNIEKNEQVYLAVVVGYGAEVPVLHPRNKNNVVYL